MDDDEEEGVGATAPAAESLSLKVPGRRALLAAAVVVVVEEVLLAPPALPVGLRGVAEDPKEGSEARGEVGMEMGSGVL